MKGARLSRLVARGLLGGVTTIIVVIAALAAWPFAGTGQTADERRIEDLQRLSHAIDAFRLRQHVLPASLSRLPNDAAAPIRLVDPVSGRPYDYRPLGPLAYELCARFDSAVPEERRVFWWHDAGRHCFALEAREAPKPPARPAPPAAPAAASPANDPAAAPATPEPPPATPPPEAAAQAGPDDDRHQPAEDSASPAPEAEEAAVDDLEGR